MSYETAIIGFTEKSQAGEKSFFFPTFVSQMENNFRIINFPH